jgi:hypothetical protein
VRAANRSGRADLPESVEVVGANVADPAEAKRACDGAAVVYHYANPPYAKWPELHPPLMDGEQPGPSASSLCGEAFKCRARVLKRPRLAKAFG